MRNVYLAQTNFQFGNNVFLPYSVGCLQAYAQSIPAIAQNYAFKELLFLRDPPDQVVERMEDPDVLGLSCYQWNWEWNKTLAIKVKQLWPQCLIVIGGPQVPSNANTLVLWADLEICGEGEEAFAGALLARAENYNTMGKVNVPRVEVLDKLPSAYLAGVFDYLLIDYPQYKFHATSETHRGCPFECAFCDWGSAIYTKVRPFSAERVYAEYIWMAEHQIELVYNADANFAMLPRDEALIDSLIDLKSSWGYPKQLRAAWAKNSTKKTFQIAHKLQQAGMNKGVTLALQSLHEPTLKAIKRQNIKWDDWQKLAVQYQESHVATYTELIMGLPEETLETFKAGIDKLLEAGQHNGLNIYFCSLLPNAEMSTPTYRKKYGIKSHKVPLLQNHASIDPYAITEYGDYVVGTKTADVLGLATFAWVVQAFHTLGLTQWLARKAFEKGVKYSDFYSKLLRYAKVLPKTNLLNQEFHYASDALSDSLLGDQHPLGGLDARFGNVFWPIEEMTFLRIMARGVGYFYEAIEPWIKSSGLAGELDTQASMLRTPDEFGGDLESYAREVVWFGRKGGFFLKEVAALKQ